MNDDDAGEDLLARIDLHTWRVPPPVPFDRSSVLARTVSPPPPERRARRWAAVLAIANVVLLAAIVVVVVVGDRPRRPQPHTIVQPAGGVDPQTTMLLGRLEQEQRALERKLAEVQQLRSAVEALSVRVQRCEQASHRDRSAERRDASRTPKPSSPVLPDTLDRDSIFAGIASIRAEILGCGRQSNAKGTVTVRVRVAPGGHVQSVLVDRTTDVRAACVANAVQSAIFAPTHHGGAFSYPFAFGASP